jgi:hypothetical protein
LKQRYKQAAEFNGPSDSSQNAQKSDDSTPPPLHDRHAWNTEEGAVVIEQKGDTVFITESLDDATSATLEKEVLGGPSPAK